MRPRSACWISLFLVLGLAACNPGERAMEAAIEAQTGADVDLDAESGTVTLRGEEGEEMTFSADETGIELPDDFPSAIPVYPDARAVQYANMGEGVQAAFQVAAAANDVRDWYIEQLEDGGWEIQMNTITPDGGMMLAELEGQTLSVMLGAEEDETTIIVTLSRN